MTAVLLSTSVYATSRWNKLGQKLDRNRNPISFDNNARVHPFSVHPDLRPDNVKKKEEEKKDKEKK